MGRDTGTQENKDYNAQMAATQASAEKRNVEHTQKYDALLKTLQAGGKIAANPYEDPGFLQNQNILTSAATSASNAGAKEMLDTQAQRTGVNTSARKATLADLARSGMRSKTEYQAGQAADNYDRYLDWQKFILGSVLAPTNVDTSMFQSATSGRNNATQNLAQIGIADKQMFGNILGAGLQAAGAVGGGFAGRK